MYPAPASNSHRDNYNTTPPWFQSSNSDPQGSVTANNVVSIVSPTSSLAHNSARWYAHPDATRWVSMSSLYSRFGGRPPLLMVAENTRAHAQALLNFGAYHQVETRSIKEFLITPEMSGAIPAVILLDMSPAYYNNYPWVRAIVDRVKQSSAVQIFALAHRSQIDIKAGSYDQRLAVRHGLDGVLPGNALREDVLASFVALYGRQHAKKMASLKWLSTISVSHKNLWAPEITKAAA